MSSIQLEKLNERTFLINLNNASFQVKYSKEKWSSDITELVVKNVMSFKAGDKFTYLKEPYLIKEIVKDAIYKDTFKLIISKLNCSYLFLLPALGGTHGSYKANPLLINCYFKVFYEQEDFPVLYLRYRDSNSKDFKELDTRLVNHPLFLDKVNVDSYNIIFKFKIPTQYHNDYKIVINSKYSEVSEALKEQILRFNDLHSANNKHAIHQVLYKSPERKARLEQKYGVPLLDTSELWEYFDNKKETFNEEDIITCI